MNTKRALMGLILPAIIGASAAFAQQPTLNKLNLTPIKGGTEYQASALNNISGAVVIPAIHNGRPVTDIGNFQADITSVIIPDGVQITGWGFGNCKNLISVIFQGSNITVRKDRIPSAFPGDLLIAYQANGAGTYTRPAGGKNWTKQRQRGALSDDVSEAASAIGRNRKGGGEQPTQKFCPTCGKPL